MLAHTSDYDDVASNSHAIKTCLVEKVAKKERAADHRTHPLMLAYKLVATHVRPVKTPSDVFLR